jgi:hypothetical protein
MAEVKELKKLSRDKLNAFALEHGIENAADETVFKDKGALATELSPKVTPEQLAEFIARPADPAMAPAPAGEVQLEEENKDEQETAQINDEPQVIDGVRYFKDGDKVCAVFDESFENLVVLPALATLTRKHMLPCWPTRTRSRTLRMLKLALRHQTQQHSHQLHLKRQ